MAKAIIQYDITSCYFEGRYDNIELIQHGYSRDHRSDARQINLGLSVTGKSGLPLLYEVLVFLTMLALVIYTILEWLVRRKTPGHMMPRFCFVAKTVG